VAALAEISLLLFQDAEAEHALWRSFGVAGGDGLLSGGISLEGREEVARYLRTFPELRAAALPASRSSQLIRAVARSYDRAA
jgi:hypothetical protein